MRASAKLTSNHRARILREQLAMKLTELHTELGRLLYRDCWSQTNVLEVQNIGSDVAFICDESDLRRDLQESRDNEERIAKELTDAEEQRDIFQRKLEDALAALAALRDEMDEKTDLLTRALPCVEESEEFEKPNAPKLSALIRKAI